MYCYPKNGTQINCSGMCLVIFFLVLVSVTGLAENKIPSQTRSFSNVDTSLEDLKNQKGLPKIESFKPQKHQKSALKTTKRKRKTCKSTSSSKTTATPSSITNSIPSTKTTSTIPSTRPTQSKITLTSKATTAKNKLTTPIASTLKPRTSTKHVVTATTLKSTTKSSFRTILSTNPLPTSTVSTVSTTKTTLSTNSLPTSTVSTVSTTKTTELLTSTIASTVITTTTQAPLTSCVATCGTCSQISSWGGIIQSPNYPSSYTPSTDFQYCYYTIRVPSGKRIKLVFDQLNIAVSEWDDILKVFDNSQENPGPVLAIFRKGDSPFEMTTKGNSMLVFFESNAGGHTTNGQIARWQATYFVVD